MSNTKYPAAPSANYKGKVRMVSTPGTNQKAGKVSPKAGGSTAQANTKSGLSHGSDKRKTPGC